MVHSFKFIRVSRQKYCKVTRGFLHRTIFNLSSRSLRFLSLSIEESANEKQKKIYVKAQAGRSGAILPKNTLKNTLIFGLF